MPSSNKTCSITPKQKKARNPVREMPTSAEDVIWCYRSILGREPESAAVVERHLAHVTDLRSLVIQFINSRECRNKKGAWLSVGLDAPKMEIELDATPSELAQIKERIGRAWTLLGSTRPHHSVLSSIDYLPAKMNEEAIHRFWASGTRDSGVVQAMLKRHDFADLQAKICAEYGCGVGRLTFPLAELFCRVHAYDVSPTHFELAKANAADRKVENVEFHQCSTDTTDQALSECDFFFSRIVFQHNPPPVIRDLISASLGTLRRGGIAIFQVPTYASNYSFDVRDYLASEWRPDMEMHCIPQAEVFRLASEAKCQILEVREDNSIGRLGTWISNTFVVKRD